jgi:hypothetical protein
MPTKPEVTVKRNGDVLVNGELAGRVVKEERPGLFGSVRTEWVAYAANGEELTGDYDTRTRAVQRVVKSVAPLEVSDVKRETGWTGDYVSAHVSIAGASFFVSRYAHEPFWVVDALFNPTSMMPVFSNGGGTRATKAYTLNGEMAEVTTHAAIDAGVWPMTATDAVDSAEDYQRTYGF